MKRIDFTKVLNFLLFKKLGPAGPLPTAIRVNGRKPGDCDFKKGGTLIVSVDFKVPQNTSTLTPLVTANVRDSLTNLTVSQTNGCLSLNTGVSCPLVTNGTATFTFSIPMNMRYRGNTQFSLLGDKGVPQFCFVVFCHARLFADEVQADD